MNYEMRITDNGVICYVPDCHMTVRFKTERAMHRFFNRYENQRTSLIRTITSETTKVYDNLRKFSNGG